MSGGIVGLKGGETAALKGQAREIHLCGQNAGGEPLAFREDRAVLADEILAGKHEIGRGFPFAGVGVDIGAKLPRGLHLHKATAESILTDALIARRQIGNDGCAGGGQRLGRLPVAPEILTDFDPETEIRQIAAAEEQLPTERGHLAREQDGARLTRRVTEMTSLVIFTVGGDMCFRDQSQQHTMLADGSTVEKFGPVRNRQTDHK